MKIPPLPLEEAQAQLLALAVPLPMVTMDALSALGHYLAQPLLARRTQPACDLSAMDGYAVAQGDLAGPWQVIGESAAGHPFAGRVEAGQAVRISTGAVVPAGAEAVILQEDVTRDGATLRLTGEAPSPPAKHIRRRGMDFCQGDVLLPQGTRIGPAQLALAISGGHAQLTVHRALKLTVIDSGDELSGDPAQCDASQIPASNGPMLAAMAAALPCHITRLGPVADNLDALAAVLEQAQDADVIVTSGGASVGDHDLIRPALEAWGAEIAFWRVAIKPGKPLLVAQKRQQLVIGLPGNPVSSYATAFLFLLPLLRSLLGASEALPKRVSALLDSPLGAGGSRREFLRSKWDGQSVIPLSLQDSGALSSLAASNALIDRPALAPEREPGEQISIYLLENGGIA